MEQLLHYTWKYKLYPLNPLVTTNGVPVTVIDTGIQNSDSGPDFFNAKIRIGDTVWAGCVEIHDKASDWFLHQHDKDKAYDNVILHVTGLDNATVRRTDGEVIPQLVLSVPETVSHNIEWLLNQESSLPCSCFIREIDPFCISSWLAALLSERLERKTGDIFTLLDHYKNDWNEVFYITLSRNFGFGINNDAFEWLAKSLPLRYLQKQRAGSSQVEAMLFGQAGMLEEDLDCSYYNLLRREYQYLSHKFGLHPLDKSLFKSLRIRPENFPHIKLAQLAAIWTRYDTLFSQIIDANSTGQIKNLFRIQPSSYWNTHYHFRYASPEKEKPLGEGALNILLINTVVPILFAYGLRESQSEYCGRALTLLESIPTENNTIVHLFQKQGIRTYNASDSQALIQLRKEYCLKKKCLYCRIGFNLIQKKRRTE